tara:strand:- start:89167 stop:89589 length:423 start_codon:yes stop_codon:yes gene_type:complete
VVAGESALPQLLQKLAPEFIGGEFVFCSVAEASYGDYVSLSPLAAFQEREGLTLVMQRTAADEAGLVYAGVFRGITLGVHSSLEAVGLTAAVAQCLAGQGISANVIAAYYHDHVFVPTSHAEQAMLALRELVRSGSRDQS